MLNVRNRKKPVHWFQLQHRAASFLEVTQRPRAGYGSVWRMGRYSEQGESTRMRRQKTLCREVRFGGVGLHSGTECDVTLRPAEAGHGVIFRRTDLNVSDNAIAASPSHVVMAEHGTTLANEAGVRVSTIEHLMAALAICGVDNICVDVDGPEIPILDGSSAQFVAEITAAGCAEQDARIRPLVIFEPIRVGEADRFIEFTPGPRRLVIEIDFAGCLIGSQSLTIDLEDADGLAMLATARTFCRLEDVDRLRSAGLIQGGGLENSLVVDGDRLLNDEPLRHPEEFALHKALDLIGDLALIGAPIQGCIKAVRPGHAINTHAARELLCHAKGLTQAPETGKIHATA